MPKRAAIYIRVSTDGQTTENQRRELEDVADRSGWTIMGVYEDASVSGAKGRDKRPAFDKLCRDATRRKFDVVMAWSVDRLGRSLQDLVGFLNDLRDLGVDLSCTGRAWTPPRRPAACCFRCVASSPSSSAP